MPDVDTNGNDLALLALSTLEILNVDDDFLSKLKGTYSTRTYFCNKNIKRRSRQEIEESPDKLFSYHKSSSDSPSGKCFDLSVVD